MWPRLQAFVRNPIFAICVIAVVLTVFLVQAYVRAYRPDGYDLTSYLMSSSALVHGENPYATETAYPYIYPLFLAFVLVPLAVAPYWLSNFAWFALSAGSLFAACGLLLKIAWPKMGRDDWRRLSLPGLAVFAVMLLPIQNTLLNGQVNFIVLFCCVMFLRYFTEKKCAWAGAWLGAAIAIKLVPAALLLFVLVRRRYRVLCWTVFFAGVFCLLPGLLAGENLVTFYKSYVDSFLLPAFSNKGHGGTVPFSIKGVLIFMVPALRASVWAKILGLGGSLAAMLSVDAATAGQNKPQRDAWSFCVYMLGCLFMSPMSEHHHLALALPAVLLVGVKVFSERHWARGWVLFLTIFFVICFDIMPKVCEKTPFYFVALVTLLILVVLAARDEREGVFTSVHTF